jgi:hypothetical protein
MPVMPESRAPSPLAPLDAAPPPASDAVARSAPDARASSLPALAPPTVLPTPARIVLPEQTPDIEELFRFSREAELRVRALRMVIEERRIDARGETTLQHELWLRHPGQARLTTRRDQRTPSRDYEVWLLDGGKVTTYAASRGVASRRPLGHHVAGIEDPSLPPFARQRVPLTALPAGSLVDSFVHPHGLFRNVLVTGPLTLVGRQMVGGREAIVVRAEHPRSARVLVDRPDRSLEVGVDRQTGFVLLLEERIAEVVTRRAEVTELIVDPVVPSSAFVLRLPADVRMLY